MADDSRFTRAIEHARDLAESAGRTLTEGAAAIDGEDDDSLEAIATMHAAVQTSVLCAHSALLMALADAADRLASASDRSATALERLAEAIAEDAPGG